MIWLIQTGSKSRLPTVSWRIECQMFLPLLYSILLLYWQTHQKDYNRYLEALLLSRHWNKALDNPRFFKPVFRASFRPIETTVLNGFRGSVQESRQYNNFWNSFDQWISTVKDNLWASMYLQIQLILLMSLRLVHFTIYDMLNRTPRIGGNACLTCHNPDWPSMILTRSYKHTITTVNFILLQIHCMNFKIDSLQLFAIRY